MQRRLLQQSCKPFHGLILSNRTTRGLSTASKPWFVDDDEEPTPSTSQQAQKAAINIPPVPEEAPQPLKTAHAHLKLLPHLDLSTLQISRPLPAEFHPINSVTPNVTAKARRMVKKWGEQPGHGVSEPPGQGVWNWMLVAQVKEGTEARGAIEAVAGGLREVLKKAYPRLPVPSKSIRREKTDGWAMLDIGDSVIHIVSRKARARWFDEAREW